MVNYTDEQFNEIYAAKRKGVDLSKIMNVDLTPEQMREIRIGEVAGVNTSLYANAEISAEKMRMTRKFLIKGLPITEQDLEQYNEAQLNEIRLGAKFGLDTKEYSSPLFSAKHMKKMRFLLLGRKIFEYLKETSIGVIHRIEDRVDMKQTVANPNKSEPVQQKASVEPKKNDVDVNAEKVQDIIINALETMDLSNFQDIKEISQAIRELLKDDKFLESISTESEEPDAPHGTYEILKTVTIDEESFAVVRNVETNQFYTVDHYDDVNESSATWNIEKEHKSYEEANKALSAKIMETKETSKVVVEENPVAHGEDEAQLSEENQKIVITEETSVHDLLKYSSSKNVEDRVKVAVHTNTSPSVLSKLAYDDSQDVAVLAIQNKNIPTGTLKGIMADEKVADILKSLANVSLASRDNKSTKVMIDNTCIVDEILPKSKGLGKLTIIKVPMNEQIGNHATIIVPSFAIEDTAKGKSLSLVNNRNYELRINAKESIMIDGKTLCDYFKGDIKKSLSLNDRIKNAEQKQALDKTKANEEKKIEKSKER